MCWQGHGSNEFLCIDDWNYHLVQTLWNITAASTKAKDMSILRSNNPNQQYIDTQRKECIQPSKECSYQLYSLYAKLETIHIFTSKNMGNKLRSIQTLVKWRKLALITFMLSRSSQIQDSTLCIIPFLWNSRTEKTKLIIVRPVLHTVVGY